MYDGTLYRSQAESRYAMWLDSEKRLGRIKSWKYEVRIELHVLGGKKLCDYLLDFEVTFPNGRVEWHEVKGVMTPVAAMKLKHTRLEYNKIVKVIKASDLRR